MRENTYKITAIIRGTQKNRWKGVKLTMYCELLGAGNTDDERVEFTAYVEETVTAKNVDDAMLLFRLWHENRAKEGTLRLSQPVRMDAVYQPEIDEIEITNCALDKCGIITKVSE